MGYGRVHAPYRILASVQVDVAFAKRGKKKVSYCVPARERMAGSYSSCFLRMVASRSSMGIASSRVFKV